MTQAYNIDPAIRDLDYKSLFCIAEYLERQAEIITAYARYRKGKADQLDEIDRRIEYLRKTPETVMKLLRRGYSLAEAHQEAAKICNTELITIQTHWDRFLDEKNKKAIKKRNQFIIDLRSIGLTNVAIAERLGLHSVTVSRIASRARKKAL